MYGYLQFLYHIYDWNDYHYRLQLTWVWVCCRCFNEVHVVAFRRSPNLRDLLVRALNSPTTTTHPSPLLAHSAATPDRHGCLTCPYINPGKTSYTFTNTGETRQIKHHITCDPRNLTYMIQCKRGKKTIYIGETKRTLRERFKEHRQTTTTKKNSTQTPQQR